MTHERWEYLQQYMTFQIHDPQTQNIKEMNQLGAAGWELVSVVTFKKDYEVLSDGVEHHLYTYKRKL